MAGNSLLRAATVTPAPATTASPPERLPAHKAGPRHRACRGLPLITASSSTTRRPRRASGFVAQAELFDGVARGHFDCLGWGRDGAAGR